ncbi:MAG: ATP-binding cassette domain-containing protein [Alphaproteobacteria bacterium]
MISVRGLVVPGLDPIDLDIDAGECLALTGPSGSGKSLVLRALADLDPNEGRVTLDGRAREATPAPEWRRQVAYLAAEPGWWEDVVGDHFADRGALAELLPILGLAEGLLGQRVGETSTGERQRLALARVLLNEPRVLLLDEPTAALDEAAARCVEDVLAERLRRGAAILLVTHDPARGARLAARRLRIAGRRIETVAA